MRRRGSPLLPGLILALAAAPPFGSGTVQVTDAWSRATPPGTTVGAAYLTIENHGLESERLVAVRSLVATMAEVHSSVLEGGVMQMEKVDGLSVEPGGLTVLEPGGTHVMLMGLRQRLAEGDRFSLVLTFEPAGDVEVEVEVEGMENGAHSDSSTE